MSAVQEGREAMLAIAPSTPDRNELGCPYLRTIAQALERHLLKDSECAVHWVAVVDEPDAFGAPTRIWTYDGSSALNDCLLQVSLAQGFSEGMLLYVHAQPDRYRSASLTPLLRIKLLCGSERAAKELLAVWQWFNSEEFYDLTRPPTAKLRSSHRLRR